MIREQRRVNFGGIPAWEIGMDPVHECRVVSHLGRERAEQVTDPLLMSNIHVEVPDHDDTAGASDAA